MKLGGFVIHGDEAATLARCLDSIAAVAPVRVAVDSCSTDGSAELDRAHGFRRVVHPWEGYGAARAVAVRELASEGCTHVFFLDSDEWLLPDAVEALRRFAAAAPDAPFHSLVRRDWAELPRRRFLYRTERQIRIVRIDHARWEPGMIVHETLPPGRTERLPIALEHRFATDAASLRAKAERYALLWALRFHLEGRRAKPPELERAVHFVREALLKGSLLRGGVPALRLAAAVAHHQARKYELLRELRRGAHADLVLALREGRFADVFREVPRRA